MTRAIRYLRNYVYEIEIDKHENKVVIFTTDRQPEWEIKNIIINPGSHYMNNFNLEKLTQRVVSV